MTITICGSLTFFPELSKLQKQLEDKGHKVLVPKSLDLLKSGTFKKPETVKDRLKDEATHDFIREHFRKIEKADAVLVANYEKKGIKGYVGGNTLIEMGIAFYLGKKIYLLYPIPDMEYCALEIHAMRPIILKGDLNRL